MKHRLFLSVFGLALLSGCGGDGTVAVQPIAAPPAAPPAPPTFPLSASTSFDAISATRASIDQPNDASLSLGAMSSSGRGSGVTVAYDATNGTYTVNDGSRSASFGSNDRTSSGGSYEVYTKQTGTITDQLTLLGNVRSGGAQLNPPIVLSYLSYGVWSHADTPAGQLPLQQRSQVQRTYFLIGSPTTAADMPRTGSASYQTAVTGNVIEVGLGGLPQDTVAGTATFDVDFGSATLKTDLTLTRSNGLVDLGTYNGKGTLSGDQFSGSFTSAARYFVGGTFNGGFFGPSAQEMGYAFQILKHNPDPFAGASPYPSDTAIIGVVVGTKR